MTEAQFQLAVLELAGYCGWKRQHSKKVRVRRPDGSCYYATPVDGDKGYPDLTLARDGRILIVELKTDSGTLKKDQVDWSVAIGPVHYRLWRPRDWDEIVEELK